MRLRPPQKRGFEPAMIAFCIDVMRGIWYYDTEFYDFCGEVREQSGTIPRFLQQSVLKAGNLSAREAAGVRWLESGLHGGRAYGLLRRDF